jgi:hypothetical protein
MSRPTHVKFAVATAVVTKFTSRILYFVVYDVCDFSEISLAPSAVASNGFYCQG